MRTSLFGILLVSSTYSFHIGFPWSPWQQLLQLQSSSCKRLWAQNKDTMSSSNIMKFDEDCGDCRNSKSDDDPTLPKAGSSIPQFDPSEKLELRQDKLNVGNPQILVKDESDITVTDILRELAAIRQEGPQKYCILGTRHCSYLHQQIIELLYVGISCEWRI